MKVSGPLGHGRELIGSFGEFHDLHLAEERDINQACLDSPANCLHKLGKFALEFHATHIDGEGETDPPTFLHLLVHLLCVEA